MKTSNEKLKDQTMTVSDLIDYLKDFDDDAPVIFTSDYGDYWHTQQALPIRDLGRANVQESSYSHSGHALAEDAEIGEAEFVVIGSECLDL